MSICECKKPYKIRISDEKWIQDEMNLNMIRCCNCGGKWGILNLDTNIIVSYNDKHKSKPTRYISKQVRYVILKRQNWRCNSCGKHLKYSNHHKFGEDVAHIDHIHPFADWQTYDGDINEINNLQALCGECNSKKYNRKD